MLSFRPSLGYIVNTEQLRNTRRCTSGRMAPPASLHQLLSHLIYHFDRCCSCTVLQPLRYRVIVAGSDWTRILVHFNIGEIFPPSLFVETCCFCFSTLLHQLKRSGMLLLSCTLPLSNDMEKAILRSSPTTTPAATWGQRLDVWQRQVIRRSCNITTSPCCYMPHYQISASR